MFYDSQWEESLVYGDDAATSGTTFNRNSRFTMTFWDTDRNVCFGGALVNTWTGLSVKGMSSLHTLPSRFHKLSSDKFSNFEEEEGQIENTPFLLPFWWEKRKKWRPSTQTLFWRMKYRKIIQKRQLPLLYYFSCISPNSKSG
jgi:hypothetical protein